LAVRQEDVGRFVAGEGAAEFFGAVVNLGLQVGAVGGWWLVGSGYHACGFEDSLSFSRAAWFQGVS
jgi:hypothetical protein